MQGYKLLQAVTFTGKSDVLIGTECYRRHVIHHCFVIVNAAVRAQPAIVAYSLCIS
jgi:hypothetical protein